MIHEAVRDSNSKEEVLLGRLATLAVRHRLEAIVPLAGDFTAVRPGLYHSFEGMESGVAFELYWAEFKHNDIIRESVGHLKEGNVVRLDKKNDKSKK